MGFRLRFGDRTNSSLRDVRKFGKSESRKLGDFANQNNNETSPVRRKWICGMGLDIYAKQAPELFETHPSSTRKRLNQITALITMSHTYVRYNVSEYGLDKKRFTQSHLLNDSDF